MGSTKTIISVSSTVYNLAGDYDPNDRYLTAVIVSGDIEGISGHEAILRTVYSSPKLNYNSFFIWANYIDYKGNIETQITNRKRVNIAVVKNGLITPVGQTCNIEKAFIKLGDINYFAEQHIIATNPSLINTDWGVDYIGGDQITITYEDASIETIDLPANFTYTDEYLYFYVKCYNDPFFEPIIEGALIDDNNLPNTSDYTETSNVVIPVNNINLNTTVHTLVEYSDNRANEETTNVITRQESFNTYVLKKERRTYLGNTISETIQNQWYYYTENLDYEIVNDVNVQVNVEDIDFSILLEDGSNLLLEDDNKVLLETDRLTATTTITSTVENLENNYSYQIDEQIENLSSLASYELIIYKFGSGNVIWDTLQDTSTPINQDFFPILPLRLHNDRISNREDWYKDTKEGYRRSINANLDDLLDSLETNPSLGDIDHAYIHFGFSLNSKSNFEREYIYKFFKQMITYQQSNNQDYQDWLDDLYTDSQFIEAYVKWFVAQSDLSNPLYDTPQPEFAGNVTKPPETMLKMLTGESDNLDLRISWANIDEAIYTGLAKVDAKAGDYWISTEPPILDTDLLNTFNSTREIFARLVSLGLFTQDNLNLLDNSFIYIYNQIDENNYRVLSISNMVHRNYIYRDYYHVAISARDALADDDLSGFIVPLVKSVLDKMSLVHSNEILLRSGNIIFNSLQIVKQKWYQSSFFRVVITIILVIIAIVVTVMTGGADGGSTAQLATLLATSLAISATTALIIAAIITVTINMIVGMIIARILFLILRPIIGERYARLVSVIATVVIMAGIGTEFDLSKLSNVLLQADKIIMFTSQIVQTAMEEYYDIEGLQENVAKIKQESDRINKYIDEVTGELNLEADNLISKIVEVAMLSESPDEFLNRTLMTSDDVIDITMSAINKFTEINL